MNSMNKSVNEPVISVIFNFSSEWREWSDLPSSYLKPEDTAPATHLLAECMPPPRADMKASTRKLVSSLAGERNKLLSASSPYIFNNTD